MLCMSPLGLPVFFASGSRLVAISRRPPGITIIILCMDYSISGNNKIHNSVVLDEWIRKEPGFRSNQQLFIATVIPTPNVP